ncbi:HU family DNA-binding protein [Photobacterium damselae]|uniref:HU family DNA-binding protein n=1 Tax=Photobacterium damselae TaxID=38293 RepID=UPI001EED7AAD|nr:HU family DNA-binding protein [Photobacterium damselae]UKA04518.1 HU family DNA-binding protein [Photobacterium damselae subsp. damselae]
MQLPKSEKITKVDIVSDAASMSHIGCKPYKMKRLLNEFIEYLKFEILGSNCAVLVSSLGRLTPKIKKAGRVVRNPMTGEEKIMPEIATVTLTSRFSSNPQQIRYTEKQLVKKFIEFNKSAYCDKKSATLIIQSFFNSIRKVSESENLILEIRGFGMFTSKFVPEGLSRNPKTGEVVVVESHLKPHFKISGTLKKELYPKLKMSVNK